ncbi:ABC transporter ATP-binding protein [Candidatus Bathyarchaeota archaeon RBG_13_38_9]|nr:MAG: ABC transporter ATP-binding protein [Candidatus Bathyarchaeota archaeon RBG_13_38_9]
MNRTNEFAIELVDLKKIFVMGKMVKVHALRGVNLKVRDGEMVSIIGPSGSGKSTLLNLLGALDRPTSGKIIIDGINIAGLKDDALSRFRNRKIGFIFQSYNLINRSTVTKNIELPAIIRGIPRTIRRRRVNELLDLVGLRGKANRKPTELSGGEQQRVAIARALINEPAFILADEPTGNLDSNTGQEIGNLLLRVNEERKATIAIVTHNIELAETTERILHLRDGIVEKETSGLVFHKTSAEKNRISNKSINAYREK